MPIKVPAPFNPFNCLKTERQKSARRNLEVFFDYWTRIKEIAVNLFVWEGLPETVDPRFLEVTLFERGAILGFNDEYIGSLALPFVGGNPIDVYGIPVNRRAYAWNGYNYYGNKNNSVICWNNFTHTPAAPTVAIYAERLADIDRSIDVNVRSQKTPLAVLCEDHERLSYLNAYKDYDGNVPVIFGSKNLDLKNITVLNTQAPFVSLDLQTLKKQMFNEVLTYLGINNTASEKKERQVATEAIASQGAVEANRFSRLHSRELAAEEFNKKLGWNCSVSVNETMIGMYSNLVEEIEETEVV